MKKRIITASAALFLLVGAVLLIAPRISNHIGKEEAHSAIEQFEELKGSIEHTVPTQSSTDTTKPTDEPTAAAQHSEERSIDDYRSDDESYSAEYHIDADRLYRDSVAYNEKLKTEQYNLLINETSYRQASLNLYDYGVPNNIYGYISAASIGMELPIFLGATDDNMAFGAAHLTYTSLPIGGESTNCVLAAHTGYIGRVFFDDIRYLQIGDVVTITNYWDKLTYKVTDKQIYKKYESSNCYITDKKDLLTLITCAHGGADRYYVMCERVDNLSTSVTLAPSREPDVGENGNPSFPR